jgi:hypothetical protein
MVAPTRSDTPQDARPTLYLVFAGLHHDARRGTGDLVAVSPSRENARAAFRAVRLRLADGDGWAELTEVSHDGTARRLSWFGTDRWTRPNPLAALVHGEGAAATSRRRRRRTALLG